MLLQFTAVATLGSLVLVLWDANRSGDRHLAFVILAIWLRYALSAFPDITSQPIAGGMSINALATFLVSCIGALVVAPRSFLIRSLVPLYLVFAVVVVSGLINASANGMIVGCLRLSYLLVLQLALFNAAMRLGMDRVIRSLLLVFCLPLTIQWASIVLGVEKLHDVTLESWQDIELIGHNYVGTYEHESTMSIMLVTFLVVLMLWRNRSILYWICLALALAGLHYSNYRTVTLAGVPVIAAIVSFGFFGLFHARSRLPAFVVLAALAFPLAVWSFADGRLMERFSDIGAVSELDLTQDPYQLTAPERDMLTGRYYIWVEYMAAWRDGNIVRKVIGFGPESWKGTFVMYAHNLYISTLYETGLVGFAVLLFYLASLIYVACSVADVALRLKLLAGYAAFAIMSFATMPMWKIEGLVLLAILNGSAMFFSAFGVRRTACGSQAHAPVRARAA